MNPGEINQKDFTEYNDPEWQEDPRYNDDTPGGYSESTNPN